MEDLFLEMYALLLHRSSSIVGNDEDAKDIVQDLFVLIKTQECPSETISNPRGYLYGMVTNMSRQFIRRQKNHSELEWENRDRTTCATIGTNFYVDDLLMPLSELQKSIVRLHDIEGYTCIEIALKLKRTPATVKKQLALAHRKIRETYKQ